jgi:hypothetical protein
MNQICIRLGLVQISYPLLSKSWIPFWVKNSCFFWKIVDKELEKVGINVHDFDNDSFNIAICLNRIFVLSAPGQNLNNWPWCSLVQLFAGQYTKLKI